MRRLLLVPGRPLPPDALGAVLVRDLVVDGERWPKGRQLIADDLARLARPGATTDAGARSRAGRAFGAFAVLALDPGEVHEDDAALRLAAAVGGPGTVRRGPAESRVDLLAAVDGVLHVRVPDVERLDRIDPLQLFTLFDGQVVRAGETVASVKIGPHAVGAAVLDRGIALASRHGPPVAVRPFLRRRVAVLAKEPLGTAARERFEESLRSRVAGLGSELAAFAYVPDEVEAVVAGLGRLVRGRGRADIVLTAGAASTDPGDSLYVAVERLGGRVVRHGVPAHPGSMVWLARIGPADVLGLPTCGAYSKATAADLILPRLLTGERASAQMAARLGHGGILTRTMRFRFPAYARDLEAPDG